ncbi:FAD-linked sulfhydryl oxidase ERV2 [Golovinomyces cichoracearum]|uniref:Sulfhydryl oxidase n=1 Tax=Golovinomyces cichoracearum TaxID=62708 RepID=A0A420HET4_9PEZI|nr:FAD-linked sulfhydryl oxidase ERV2 [Golovinomyces cichoracearum]
MARRASVPSLMMFSLMIIFAILLFARYRYQTANISTSTSRGVSDSTSLHHSFDIDQNLLHGNTIANKLDNETVKADLGRSSWKLLHTMMAKFPDHPTDDERKALDAYIHLFARLYPCGECARHFQEIIKKFPPQVATRSTAAIWACHVHNQVNKSLRKELFDCSKIGDFYDCGCASEEPYMNSTKGKES